MCHPGRLRATTAAAVVNASGTTSGHLVVRSIMLGETLRWRQGAHKVYMHMIKPATRNRE